MRGIRFVLLTTAGILAVSSSGILADGRVEPRRAPRGHSVAGTRVSAPVGQAYNRARIQTRGHTAPVSSRAPGPAANTFGGKVGGVNGFSGFSATSGYPMSYQLLRGSMLPDIRPRGFEAVNTRKATNDIRRLIRKLDLDPI